MAWPEFRKTKKWVAKRIHPKTGVLEYGAWYAIGRHPVTKKTISEPAGIESNLKAALAVIEQIELGKDLSRDAGRGITIKAAYDEYEILMRKTRKAGTWSAYDWALVKLLAHFGGDKKIKTISREDMKQFRKAVMPKHSINGLLDIIKIVRAFFSYCVEDGHIDTNPAQGLSKGIAEQDVAVFLTDDQAGHILSCIDNPDVVEIKKNHAGSKEEFGDIIRTVLLTGMRRGDICGLKASHIQDGKINIKGKGRGTGKSRVVGINKNLAPFLDKYLARGTEFIFQGWNNRRITSQWNRLYKRAKKADPKMPPRARFHDLRHTFASNYMRGKSIPPPTLADLQSMLGHSSLKTTIRYVHLQEADLVAKMQGVHSGWMDKVAPKLQVIR